MNYKGISMLLIVLLLFSGCRTRREIVGSYVYRCYPNPEECWVTLKNDSTFSCAWINPYICYMGVRSPISNGHYTVRKDSVILDFIRDRPFVRYYDSTSNVYELGADGLIRIKVMQFTRVDTSPGEQQKQKILFTQYAKIYGLKTQSNYLQEFSKSMGDSVISDLQRETEKKLYLE